MQMRRVSKSLLVTLGLTLSANACGPGGSTGASGGNAPTGSGGVPSASGGGSPGGGAGSGGRTGAGGSSGGAAGGGVGGAPASGGVTGSGGAGSDGKVPAEPSQGCGKASPATGSSAAPLEVANHDYYVKLPAAYDENKPYPVLIMFHPSGNPLSWAENNAGYEQTAAKDEAIRVYPGSQGNGWETTDVPFFEPFYEKILGDYCVDQARVFAAGESSGGDIASVLGCEHADKLRAVAPCATKDDGWAGQYPLQASTRQCTGQVTAIVIHGIDDSVVGPENGPLTRDFYKALNHCQSDGAPVEGYDDELSNCVLFSGCDAGYPVYWCQHNDPEYGGTSHGWPKFAARMTWGVFSEY